MAVNEEGKFTKLTPETIKLLEDAFAMDCSIVEACLNANIRTQTYYNWIKDNPELAERFKFLKNGMIPAHQETTELYKKIYRKFGLNINKDTASEILMIDDFSDNMYLIFKLMLKNIGKSVERIKNVNRARRHRIRKSKISTTKLLKKLIKQDYKCVYCGEDITEFRHIDHIKALANGGRHTINNIQFLCPHCNLVKGKKTEEEFIKYVESR